MSLSITQGFSIFACCYSAALWIHPKPLLELYGANPSPKMLQLSRFKGGLYLSLNITAAFMLFGSNFYQAMTAGYMPWILQALRSIFIDKDHCDPRLKIPLACTVPPLIVAPFFLYGYASEMHMAPIVFGIIHLINGISAASFPDSHTKAWGSRPDAKDDLIRSVIRTLGFGMGGLGTLVLTTALGGASPAQAYGFALCNLLGSAALPLLDWNGKLGKFKGAVFVWIPVIVSVLYASFLRQ
mmetsp:Transcript_2929/g.8245  ORF Transcript_2929/g.8245 Transcript_2929/m.8245 type:complete len:241 (+) Transcript_2929:168-890(+)|eukprot:CAMPEP_0168739020 /NCGR_PEP_ID=MMETSP0724-20121128/11237_1 /TAXON_ID=265536 /ORGANISM="Amphiprora sp., Strain CCMP467" /LENGTH=240 /DNA_ID=CAMNT_0008786389 /DNA_START=160 /DNA_END=882 /DNA_ORIENTATION=+